MMLGGEKRTWSLIESVVGRDVASIERVFFEHSGAVDRQHGPLQFRFGDGSILRLDVANDGERLLVSCDEWQDPFVEPLSDENRAYVEECGKWILVSLSNAPEHAGLIGAKVCQVIPIFNRFGTLAGAQFRIGSSVLNFFVDGDEADVVFGSDAEALASNRLQVSQNHS